MINMGLYVMLAIEKLDAKGRLMSLPNCELKLSLKNA
jgi:hypothetical protein